MPDNQINGAKKLRPNRKTLGFVAGLAGLVVGLLLFWPTFLGAPLPFDEVIRLLNKTLLEDSPARGDGDIVRAWLAKSFLLAIVTGLGVYFFLRSKQEGDE